MRRTSIFLRLIGLVALVTLALVAPAHGANSQVFDDAVGDNGGAGTNSFAADIISTRVESADNGDLTFTVTLKIATATGNLESGDVLQIFIDSDKNQNTGILGDEAKIEAYGVTNGAPFAQFCEPGQGDWSCENDPDFSYVFTTPDTHVLSFRMEPRGLRSSSSSRPASATSSIRAATGSSICVPMLTATGSVDSRTSARPSPVAVSMEIRMVARGRTSRCRRSGSSTGPS